MGFADQLARPYRKVNYNVGFNLSDNRVKVTKYPNESMSLNTYYNGMALGEIWGYETAGIAKSDEEMNNWLSTHDQSKLGSEWGSGGIGRRARLRI